METFFNFLETSSIGGFAHIKASKNWVERIFWSIVVASSWVFAIYYITEAFIDWANNPIATTSETRPIYDAPFPKIIVCPPKEAFVFIFLRILHVRHHCSWWSMRRTVSDWNFHYYLCFDMSFGNGTCQYFLGVKAPRGMSEWERKKFHILVAFRITLELIDMANNSILSCMIL